MNQPTRPIRALDTPSGLKVEVLGYGRGDGYAKVKPLKAGSTAFETRAERLHKPE